LLELPGSDEAGSTQAVHIRRCVIAICALIFGSLQLSPAPSRSSDQLLESTSTTAKEPVTPIPEAVIADPLKVRLGERLFGDTRLSRDNSRSCSSCHDLGANGAGRSSHDIGLDGSELPLNTLESDALASLESPRIMGSSSSEVLEKLKADPAVRREFAAAYGRGPDIANVLDAIATFERTLVTPGSRFDQWLTGDANALSEHELNGYRLFKSMGCVSCHQGVNIGGNLFQRHGIFRPLAAPLPEILRVPSLRNVATTPPYFHDGSAPTLDDAVRKMAAAQLNSTLTDQQVSAIVAYLQTLTGQYRGVPVGAAP